MTDEGDRGDASEAPADGEDDLRAVVEALREDVASLRRRVDRLEGADGSADHGGAGREAAGEAVPAGSRDRAESSPGEAQGTVEDRGRDGAAPEEDAGRDLERTVGVRWLGLVGALALVVGVVFFVRVAIERGLLGPLGRVVVGTVGGVALFGGGRYASVRQGFARWGPIAAGAGLAVAYFSVYAAWGLESYRRAIGTPLWAVLAALTVLVAAAVVFSVRDGSPVVAGEAFLLGYLTAAIGTDAATILVTPVYALLLTVGVVAIARVRPWRRLAVASVVGTYGVLGFWVLSVEPPDGLVAVAAGVAFVLYLVASGILHVAETDAASGTRPALVVLSATNAVFAAGFLDVAVRDAVPTIGPGGGTVLVAAGLTVAALAIHRLAVGSDHAAGAGAVLLTAAAVGLAAEPFATTVGWLVVLLVAVAISSRYAAAGVRVGAHGLAVALVGKLLVVDADALPAFDAADPVGTLTGRPTAFGLAIVVLYGLAWWFFRTGPGLDRLDREGRIGVDGAYAIAATGLALVGFALELAGLGVSLAWLALGVVLLSVGFAADRPGVRWLGVGVLAVTTAKVFLYDTSGLDAVARTVSFLVLGVILLVASYAYARLRGDIEVRLPGRE